MLAARLPPASDALPLLSSLATVCTSAPGPSSQPTGLIVFTSTRAFAPPDIPLKQSMPRLLQVTRAMTNELRQRSANIPGRGDDSGNGHFHGSSGYCAHVIEGKYGGGGGGSGGTGGGRGDGGGLGPQPHADMAVPHELKPTLHHMALLPSTTRVDREPWQYRGRKFASMSEHRISESPVYRSGYSAHLKHG